MQSPLYCKSCNSSLAAGVAPCLRQYGSAEEWSSLCEDLASRLEQAGDARAATLVYMCAGAVGHVLDLWAAPHQRLLDAAAGAPGSSTALGDSTISQLQVRPGCTLCMPSHSKFAEAAPKLRSATGHRMAPYRSVNPAA